MKSLCTFVFSFFCIGAFAQSKTMPEELGSDLVLPVRIIHVNQKISAKAPSEAFIKAKAGYDDETKLQLRDTRSSKLFTHYHYDVFKEGLRVFGASVHAARQKDGSIKFIQAPFIAADVENTTSVKAGEAETARAILGAEKIEAEETVWIDDGSGTLRKAVRVVLSGPETLHREVLMKDGELIYSTDLLQYFKHATAGPHDTTVTVHIFDPDPLSTAKTSYGGPYKDNRDRNHPSLHSERKKRETTLTYKNGQFAAANDYVRITEFSGPITSNVIATNPSSEFDYSRNLNEFEDLNVIFHITQHARHLAALGYPGLPGYRIDVDAHALDGLDQSFFSTLTSPFRLYFGEGGVDDAEDADVILHEFSHAVIHKAAPAANKSTQRRCIEEALCDYFAVSYSRTINSFNKHEVFNWDGHNEFFAGRTTNSYKDYQQVSFNNNYYTHTDLMASPLLDIYDKIGRDNTDELVLEAIYNLTPSSTMPQVAYFVLMSDSLLNNGVHYNAIVGSFDDRGILSLPMSSDENAAQQERIVLLNSYGFANGEPLSIKSDGELVEYELVDISGRHVKKQRLHGAKEAELSPRGLAAGIYILSVTTQKGQTDTFKLSANPF